MRTCILVLGCLLSLVTHGTAFAQDPLPSWNAGPAKQAILDFVAKTTKKGSAEFIPVEQRIATFDNDGTLWPENPLRFELAYVFDHIKAQAPQHPEWKSQQPYKSVLENDLPALLADGHQGIIAAVVATHTGMTTDQFNQAVQTWLASAKHPRYDRQYTDLVFQPMLEVLAYLRANRFKTFIVSGGESAFMRVFVEKTYGIPPEQVIGTMFKTQFQMKDDKPVLSILPELAFIDDKAGKPIAIYQLIGRRPVAAFGNSDGDWQMLQYTTIDRTPSFGLLVHHTDAQREYAYDAHTKSSGKLVAALAEAPRRGWIVVDMKQDWKRMFSFDKE